MEKPPEGIIAVALAQASFSPCRSKRGAVVFRETSHGVVSIIARAHNRKPEGFDCDGSVSCKATCRVDAIHAEQGALVRAGLHAQGAELLHVKAIDGQLVPSGPPSCVQCSKLALAAQISGVWLYHGDGWRRYDSREFHRLSLANLQP